MVDAILELIENLTRRCPLLKILTLQSLPKDYYSTRDLNLASTSLLKLEIVGGTYPTPRDIINCDCPQLVVLNMRQSNIDNFNLDYILRNCGRLHSLDVSECTHLTASRKLCSLHELRAFKANKTNIELGCVLDMLKRCTRLQTVEYSRCHNLVQASKEEADLKKLEEDAQEEVFFSVIIIIIIIIMLYYYYYYYYYYALLLLLLLLFIIHYSLFIIILCNCYYFRRITQ